MYPYLLSIHSLFRWVVLAVLVVAVLRAYFGRFSNSTFSTVDTVLVRLTAKTIQIQFCIGIILYFLSPIVRYFLSNFREAVHIREIRFFGMEHITMMILAVGVITVGADRIAKAADDRSKFKLMSLWFTIGLILILTSIPWSFSPLISRPNLRFF